MPSTFLDYITIEGFKSIAFMPKLALRPINVVIGANGSGKSNFIGVFAFLHEIREGRLREYVTVAGGAEKVLHFGSKTTEEIYIEVSFASGVNRRYELKLRPTADDGLYPSEERAHEKKGDIEYGTAFVPINHGREAGISDRYVLREAQKVQDYLGSCQVYHLEDTSPMRKTAKVDDNRFLRPNGANLPAFLYYLREKHQGSYDLIVRTVQRVALFLMTSG